MFLSFPLTHTHYHILSLPLSLAQHTHTHTQIECISAEGSEEYNDVEIQDNEVATVYHSFGR